jgi:hypothetical protein
LVKDLSLKIPLYDYQKRQALKEKIGFDIDAALRHIEEEKAEERQANNNTIEPATPQRRVKAEEAKQERRTSGGYKIVSQDNN